MEKGKSAVKGYLSYFLSMLFYAFSGLIVVSLGQVIGNITQVFLRAVVSVLFALIVLFLVSQSKKIRRWLKIGDKAGFVFTKEAKDNTNRKGLFGYYDAKWFWVLLSSRALSNVCFVYAALAINPTAALFYLFASRVLTGAVIKLIKDRKMNRFYFLSFLTVIVGMYLFSNPETLILSWGLFFAFAAGMLEALKQQGYRELDPPDEDTVLITLYEFCGTAVLALIMLPLFKNSLVAVTLMNINYWWILVFAGVTAAMTVLLDITGATNLKDPSLGNVIGATEMGFAALLNYLFIGTVMKQYEIVGSVVIVVALVFVALAKRKDNKDKDQKLIVAK